VVSLKIEYLSVRPEQRRRAPREFSHSLPLGMTTTAIVISNEVRDLSQTEPQPK
jgi:1,4-dihydroxy-2-naphthoate octaprenyltransferase